MDTFDSEGQAELVSGMEAHYGQVGKAPVSSHTHGSALQRLYLTALPLSHHALTAARGGG